MILLDSSVIIELFRKKNKGQTLFYELSEKEHSFCISTITHYEVGIGNKEIHQAYWEKISSNLEILPFDKSCSECAIKIYLELKKRNSLIPLADLLIGATAIANKLPLATLNFNDFEKLSNLKIVTIL